MGRKLKTVIVLTISLLWLTSLKAVCPGATYYLDANNPIASDNNPGTFSLPWKTLNRAYTWYSGTGPKVQEGDTVLFRDGDYGAFREHTNDGTQYLFYRNNWITYKADAGHTPNLTSISIQNADKWGEIIHGNSYLIFDGFRILNGVGLSYTSYVQVKNCNITGPTEPYEGLYAPYVRPTYGIEARTTHYITIENNDISYIYRGMSISNETDNVVIKNNTIHRIGEDGIVTSGANQVVIENNIIYDLHHYRTVINIYGTKTGDFIQGEKVILQGTAVEGIFYNHVPKVGYDIINVWQTTQADFKEEWRAGRGDTIVGQTSGATLSNISNVDPARCDCVTLMPGTDIVFRANKLIRRYGGGVDGWGLKLDNPQNVTIENNLIDTAKPMNLGGTNNCYIYNNTFYGADGIEFYTYVDTVVDNFYNNFVERFFQRDDGAGVVWIKNHGNNIIGPASKGNAYGGPAHPFVINATEMQITDANPLFIDITSGDFRLKENSVAIDFGNPDYGPKTDILDNPRDAKPDAGCYEYISAQTNRPPVANAGTDQTVVDNDRDGSEEVTLDGSASRDPDGKIVSYIWSEAGLEIANGRKPPVTLSTGTHSIELTVTDNGGLTDTDSVIIKVVKEDEEFGVLPTGCYNNVINPLKGEEASIVVELEEPGRVKIDLYDTKGNKIKQLADEEKDAGTYPYYWNGKNDSGNVVGCGLYLVRIDAGDYKKTKKIVVVK